MKTMNNFSTAAICNVSGKSRTAIHNRARSLGYDTKGGMYTADQAYNIVYYTPKKRTAHKETLAQETTRLIKSLEKYNARLGQKIVVAA